jgi:hypothetical protein
MGCGQKPYPQPVTWTEPLAWPCVQGQKRCRSNHVKSCNFKGMPFGTTHSDKSRADHTKDTKGNLPQKGTNGARFSTEGNGENKDRNIFHFLVLFVPFCSKLFTKNLRAPCRVEARNAGEDGSGRQKSTASVATNSDAVVHYIVTLESDEGGSAVKTDQSNSKA